MRNQIPSFEVDMRLRLPKCALAVLLLASYVPASAQAPTTQASTPSPSDPQAVSLITQAQAATNGGVPAADVTLKASVIWFVGKSYETGTATLRAKGIAQSRLDISAGSFTRSEIRNDSTGNSGAWIGGDGVVHAMALHNCQSIPAWFSPGFLISAMGAAQTIVSYVGREKRNNIQVDHIRYSVQSAGLYKNAQAGTLFQRLSQTEIYLDTNSHLPLDIVWNMHPDNDSSRDIPVEVRFASYQAVNGINVPYRIQRLVNGSLNLDLTITSVAVNSGLADSAFALR